MGFTEIDDELARLGEGIDVQAVFDRLGERPEDVDAALEALANGSPFERSDRPPRAASESPAEARGDLPSAPPVAASEPPVAASEPPESEVEMTSFDMEALLAEAADSDAPPLPAPARSIPPPIPVAALDADTLFADLEAEVSIANSPEESTSIFSEADIQTVGHSSAPSRDSAATRAAFGDNFEDEVTEFFTGDIELVMDEELAAAEGEESEDEEASGDKKGFFKKLFG